jgi:hypothetical protein
MFEGILAYPNYVNVPSGACPYIYLCSNTFSNVLFEGVCPCACDVCEEGSSLQIQLKTHLELHSD